MKKCEICQQNPGTTNSSYIFDEHDPDVGVWICGACEEKAERDCKEFAERLYSGRMGRMVEAAQ